MWEGAVPAAWRGLAAAAKTPRKGVAWLEYQRHRWVLDVLGKATLLCAMKRSEALVAPLNASPVQSQFMFLF